MVVLLLRGVERGQIDRQWESARSRCWHIMQRRQKQSTCWSGSLNSLGKMRHCRTCTYSCSYLQRLEVRGITSGTRHLPFSKADEGLYSVEV
jgi:hypothetical protein